MTVLSRFTLGRSVVTHRRPFSMPSVCRRLAGWASFHLLVCVHMHAYSREYPLESDSDALNVSIDRV